jgi:SRSO17 transposase
VKAAEKIAAALPDEAWQPIVLREGAKGPLVSEFARVRVWSVRGRNAGPAIWLVFRREVGSTTVKYYVSNADETVSLQTLALVIGTRWRVEEFLEDGKEHLGLADCESRGWPSWHHHVSLVGLAHLYVNLVRKDLSEDVPELTFDRAYQMVRDAMARPTLTSDDSLRLTEYYLHHNRRAQLSHRKAWLKRNKRLAKKLRL